MLNCKKNTVSVWAHRGSGTLAPENTLEAFIRTADLGTDGIEFDAVLSSDGMAVISHDRRVRDPKTGKVRKIKSMTYTEIKSLGKTIAGGLPVGCGSVAVDDPIFFPTAEEVFSALSPTSLTLNVELKDHSARLCEICARAAERFGMNERIIYSSFSPAALWRMKKACHTARTALLVRFLPFPFGILEGLGISAVHIPVSCALRYPRTVEKLHAKNMSVAVWTANSAEDISRASEIGADAIITDDPVLALRLLRRK